jgi:phage-related protein
MPPGGPSVLVRFLSDMTGLKKGIDDTATQSESAGTRIHGAFSTVIGQLNQTGILGPFGASLETANQGLDKMSTKTGSMGTKLMGLGGVALGAGLALQAAGSKEQAATQQLSASIDATGHSYDTYTTKIDAAVKHQETFGNTAAETKGALQKLTQATGDPTKALEMLGTASDLAAAKHESLGQAAGQMGKIYNGATRTLKEFGVSAEKASTSQNLLKGAQKAATSADEGVQKALKAQTELHEKLAGKTKLTAGEIVSLQKANDNVATASDKAKAAHERLDTAQKNVKTSAQVGTDMIGKLGDKLKGQASAGADTFGGKIKSMRAKVEDAVSTFGQKYGPAITIAGAATTGFGSALEVGKAAMAAYKAMTAEGAVQMAIFNAVMDANVFILIAIAVAALVAGFILLYKHSQLVREIVADIGKFGKDAFKGLEAAFHAVVDAAKKVFNWIKENWPLLAEILLALTSPLGLVIAVFIRFHDQIIGFFTKLPGEILAALGALGGLLTQVGTDIINGLWQGIQTAWNAGVGWITGLGQSILGAVGALGNLLLNVGEDVIHGLLAGLQWVWNTEVNGWLNIGQKIIGAIGNLGGLLLEVGKSVIHGLLDGLKWVWDHEVTGWLNIGQKIKGAIGTLGALLFDVGKSIINGLWDGMKNMWNNVSGWVGGLGSKIAGLKGPLEYDRKLLVPAGHAIMAGLDEGLRAGMRTVQQTLGDFTASIGAPVIVGGGGQVIGNYQQRAGGSTRSAPAIVIERAEFRETLDVDSFMRRAAWAITTESL